MYVQLIIVKVAGNVELLDGNSLQRRIDILGAVGIAVNKSALFAEHLAAVLGSNAEMAILTLGRYIVAKIFFLCHIDQFLSDYSVIIYIISHIFSFDYIII